MIGTPRMSDEDFGWQIPALGGVALSAVVVNGTSGVVAALTWIAFCAVVGMGLAAIARSNRVVSGSNRIDAELRWAKLADEIEVARHEEKELERLGESITRIPDVMLTRAA